MSIQQNAPLDRYDHMSQLRCPDCDEIVAAKSMNITQGVSLCPACGKVTRLSELSRGERASWKLLELLPDKCSLTQIGDSVKVSVSLRSIPGAVIFGVFAQILIIPGVFTGASFMNAGPWPLAIFNFLFGLPIVAVDATLILVTLMFLFGKVSVVIDEAGCYTATGFDGISWKKQFDMHRVRSIEIADTQFRWEGGSNKLIKIEADQTVKFASIVGDDARSWMVAVLRQLLMPADQGTTSTLGQRFAEINKSAKA